MRLAAFILALWAATPAMAQQQCAPREAALALLADRFNESRVGMGVANGSMVVEVFASESGSWTITVTRPDAITCMIASGEMWETLNEPPPPQGQKG
jgi:hypothetical protein